MSGLPSWAVRGRKVVCVSGGSPACFGASRNGGAFPVTNGIYTIEDAFITPRDRLAVIRLVEVPTHSGATGGWLLDRFRPLVDDSDEALERDAEFFRQFLKAPEHSVTTEREAVDAD